MTDTPKAKRGFAMLSPERRKEIARAGGSAVAAANRSFAKDPSLAARAGSIGGSVKKPRSEQDG